MPVVRAVTRWQLAVLGAESTVNDQEMRGLPPEPAQGSICEQGEQQEGEEDVQGVPRRYGDAL